MKFKFAYICTEIKQPTATACTIAQMISSVNVVFLLAVHSKGDFISLPQLHCFLNKLTHAADLTNEET